MPLISVITATYNAQETLPRLLDSLVAQTFADFELIIQDGLSSDTTEAIVTAYMPRIRAVRFASEQDHGIYDAWNKALQHVQSEWVLFLGADDFLVSPDALMLVAQELQQLPDRVLFFASPVHLVLQDGSFLETVFPSKDIACELPQGMCLPHQGLYHRRVLFGREMFNDSYKIAGDYAFICRTICPESIAYGDISYVYMTVGGVSANMDSMLHREKEFLAISRTSFPGNFPWKIYARMLRCLLFVSIKNIFGRQSTLYFADSIRRVQGKPPLWARLAAPSCACSTLPAQPHVSLVVTVIGRTEPLMTLLSSLQKQSYINFSIVLVDQNPPHVLADVCVSFPELSIKHLHTTPSGVSHARNVGLQHAQGDIIAFPDDDCWYESDALAAAVDFFREHPCYAGVLGRWMEMPPKYCTAGELKPLTRLSAFTGSETYTQFYRRDVIQAVGDFDVQMGPGTGLAWGCGEDTDYVLRAIKLGFCMGRAATIRVHHPRPLLQGALTPHLLQKHTAYALGRMYLLKKHAFPLWFKVLNVLYPLALLPLDALRQGRVAAKYRWTMFKGRLRGLFL